MPQSPLVEPLRRWDPEQVGGFVLIGRLGAGAMGQVYLGRSAAGRLVAVKTIKAELAEEPDFRNRFGQEVAAARRVSGAFTAAVVAADSEADVPWLATVYVPAPSLSRLVRTCGPIPVAAVRWLAAGCAEALESIHSVGLVHRDLKPANVLVSPDAPRVIDFGVARAAERIQLTVTRGSVGTPAYMAPEQARDTRQATSASDIFALGATMLFAATGHAPYHGETVMDVLVRLATGPPDLSGLPAELADLVRPCLERDPRSRPTSASILARLAPELTGNTDGGAPPLPRAALTLIEEYRRIPLTSPGPGTGAAAVPDDQVGASLPDEASAPSFVPFHQDRNVAVDDSATLGSQPVLGGSGRSARRHPADGVPGFAAAQRSGPARARRAALAVGGVLAAAALIAAGWAVGAAAAGSGARPAAGTSSGGARSPAASSSAGAGQQPSSQTSLGPVLPPPGGGPGGGQGPSGQQGPPLLPGEKPGVPYVALAQDTGDSNTGFVIHGQSWRAGERLTIELVGVRTSPLHPIADSVGTFNYTINEDHEFFAGGIPPGFYTVRVIGTDGASAQARFVVHAPF